MRVINPQKITDAKYTSSSIPEPDASVGEIEWTAGTYNLGDERIVSSTHIRYRVVADPSTTDDPVTGAAKATPTWIIVGATNKWAAFDQVIGTASTQATSPLIFELDMAAVVSGVAGFNISGASNVNITMTDPTEGEVYNVDVPMIDNSAVIDFYPYFFSPIIQKTTFLLEDLPPYPSATIDITISGDDAIGAGTITVGQVIDFGVAQYGTEIKLLDFHKKERDEFGNIVVASGGNYADLVDFDFKAEKKLINYIRNTAKSFRDSDGVPIPTVWYGTGEQSDPTLVYGYYRDMQLNIDSPSICDATVQIEGLT